MFKIFIDDEESKIRFVFTDDDRIVTKDMGVKNIKHTMEKLLDELNKVGLKLQGQVWSFSKKKDWKMIKKWLFYVHLSF